MWTSSGRKTKLTSWPRSKTNTQKQYQDCLRNLQDHANDFVLAGAWSDLNSTTRVEYGDMKIIRSTDDHFQLFFWHSHSNGSSDRPGWPSLFSVVPLLPLPYCVDFSPGSTFSGWGWRRSRWRYPTRSPTSIGRRKIVGHFGVNAGKRQTSCLIDPPHTRQLVGPALTSGTPSGRSGVDPVHPVMTSLSTADGQVLRLGQWHRELRHLELSFFTNITKPFSDINEKALLFMYGPKSPYNAV